MPPERGDAENEMDGVIVFKGTEPLLPDFAQYFEWMLRAPFRSSRLPLGLHFPLEMKLPPAAMWIDECIAEQEISSVVQAQYLARHRRLARLPVPLFVYELTPMDVARYEGVIRPRISSTAYRRCATKVAGGLGVEVYYYPVLPVRAADLSVPHIRKVLDAQLTPEGADATFRSWVELMADLLMLGYMPYAPWNQGMGGCVDPGNACVDGGFNDLLTLVPFDSIPTKHLFWRSLTQSIQMLGTSIVAMGVAVTNSRVVVEPDPSVLISAYIKERLITRIRADERPNDIIDSRLVAFFQERSVTDLLDYVRDAHRESSPAQFSHRQTPEHRATTWAHELA